jgi:HEAT repeat protein
MPDHIDYSCPRLVLKRGPDRASPYRLDLYPAHAPADAAPATTALLGRPDTEQLRRLTNRLLAGDARAAQELGDAIAAWLFTEQEASTALVPSWNRVGRYLSDLAGQGETTLRLWFCLDEPVSRYNEFVWGLISLQALDANRLLPLQVIRGTAGNGATLRPLKIAGKLRVLLVYANPAPGQNRPGSDHIPGLEAQFQDVRSGLNELVRRESLFLQVCHNPTKDRLIQEIRTFDPHVLCFMGHGYGPEAGHGGLVCVQEGGVPEQLSFLELEPVIQTSSLGLAVLMACRSFSATPYLMTAGVPAIVAISPLAVGYRDKEDIFDFPAECAARFGRPLFAGLARTHAQAGGIIAAFFAARAALKKGPHPAAALMPTLWLADPNEALLAPPEDRLRVAYREGLHACMHEMPVRPMSFSDTSYMSLYVEQEVVLLLELEPDDGRSYPTANKTMGKEREALRALRDAAQREQASEIVDLFDRLKAKHRVAITASAWTGKSTLCRKAVRECEARLGLLPIYIELRMLASSKLSLRDYLDREYTAWLGLEGQSIQGTEDDAEPVSAGLWAYRLWTTGQALLIVDGVDEVYEGEARRRAIDSLFRSTDERVQPYVLLTSRPQGRAELAGYEVLELNEFSQEKVKQLVEKCGTALRRQDCVESFLAALHANRAADTLAARPGHLVLMFEAFVVDGVLLAWEEEVMNYVADRRFAIPTRVSPAPEPDTPAYKRQTLEEMAFHVLFCRRGEPQQEAAMRKLVEQALKNLAQEKHPLRTPLDAEAVFQDLHRTSGFLRQVGTDRYDFESALWLQYFAVCHLARCLNGGDNFIKSWILADNDGSLSASSRRRQLKTLWSSYLKAPRQASSSTACSVCKGDLQPFRNYLWHEAGRHLILLLAGIMENATLLLERIAREPDDVLLRMRILALRALARARKVDAGVMKYLWQGPLDPWKQSIEYARVMGIPEFESALCWKQPANAIPIVAHLQALLADRESFDLKGFLLYLSFSGFLLCWRFWLLEIKERHYTLRSNVLFTLLLFIAFWNGCDYLHWSHFGKKKVYLCSPERAAEAKRDMAGQIGISVGIVATDAFLDRLVQALKGRDKKAREAAVKAVRALGSVVATDAFLDHLAQLLKDQRGYIRITAGKAVYALRERMEMDVALVRLAHLLEHRDKNIIPSLQSLLDLKGDLLMDRGINMVVGWQMKRAIETEAFLARLTQVLEDLGGNVGAVAGRAARKFAMEYVEALEVRLAPLMEAADRNKDATSRVAEKMVQAAETIGKKQMTFHLYFMNKMGNFFSKVGDIDISNDVRHQLRDFYFLLGSVEKTDQFLNNLTILLKTKHADIRAERVRSVFDLESTVATEALLTRLAQLLEDRKKKMGVIGWISPSDSNMSSSPFSFSAFADLLKDHNEDAKQTALDNIRNAAADAVAKLGLAADAVAKEAFLDQLSRSMHDQDEDVSETTIELIKNIIDKLDVAIAELHARQTHLTRLLHHPHRGVGEAALLDHSDRFLGTQRGEDVREPAVDAIRHAGRPHRRQRTITLHVKEQAVDAIKHAVSDAIAELGLAVAAETFLGHLIKLVQDENKNSLERYLEGVVKLVGTVGSAESDVMLARLGDFLADDNEDVRVAAIMALGKLGSAGATEAFLVRLVHMMEEQDNAMKTAAARAAGKIGPAAAKDPIVTSFAALLNDQDNAVRKAAVEAIGELGSAVITTAPIMASLADLLKDQDWAIRGATAKAVGKLGPMVATEAIMSRLDDLLEDKEGYVRWAAIDAVGRFGSAVPDAAFAHLARLLQKGYQVQAALASLCEAKGIYVRPDGRVERVS